MKEYTAKDIRNIGVFGHGGEGKTTLTEAMLFNAGLIDRLGKVENGTTTTDYDPEEIARGISINVALAPLEWKNTKINVIDAPGFFDFYGEVTAAMAFADSALIVISAVSGPVVGAEKAMAMCEKSHKARMIAINQLDRENANFEKVMSEINAKFGPSVVPIQLPIIEGGVFKGYVDIVNMRASSLTAKARRKPQSRPQLRNWRSPITKSSPKPLPKRTKSSWRNTSKRLNSAAKRCSRASLSAFRPAWSRP